MGSFILTQQAKADLKAIARFTEKRWGRRQRDAYIKQSDDLFHMLANSPTIGKACDYIKAGYLKFPQASHIIFYRINPSKSIKIIRILHKNMDVISELAPIMRP